MRTLILGGTGEARTLAAALHSRGDEVVTSLAGVVARPALPVGEVISGGFGGVDGLTIFLGERQIDRLVDATHPFAARISANARAASQRSGVPLRALRRPGWAAGHDDRWTRVPDVTAAAAAVPSLSPPGVGVLVTTGRRDLAPFTADALRHYIIRCVDPPREPLPPRWTLLLARGPYTVAAETELITTHAVAVLVTKDSGGEQTAAKLTAARERGVDVVMVDRPPAPPADAGTVAELLALLDAEAG